MTDEKKIDYHFGDVIEIPLPEGGSSKPTSWNSSTWPRNRKSETLKSWICIAIATVALVIAISALVKPNDPVNKASYVEIKKAIELIQQNNIRNHEDIVALHNYLAAYLSGRTLLPATTPPLPKSILRRSITHSASKVSTITVPPIPTFPDVHEQSSFKTLPEYDELEKSTIGYDKTKK